MKIIRLITLIVLLIPASFPSLADSSNIEFIPLYNRPAAEIVPLIRPFLEEGDKLVGTGNQIIIRTSDERLKEVMRLVKKFDQRPHRLLITVIQGENLTQEALSARIRLRGTIALGSSAKSRLQAGGHIRQTHSDKKGESRQSVQTLDGEQALIQFGIKQPLPEYQIHDYGSGVGIISGIRYHDVTSGFYVRPRIIGNRVQLDIAPWSDKPSRFGGGIIDTSRAETTLTTKIGVWIELGGQNNQSSESSSGILSRYQSTQKRENRIFIRIEDLDSEQLSPTKAP